MRPRLFGLISGPADRAGFDLTSSAEMGCHCLIGGVPAPSDSERAGGHERFQLEPILCLQGLYP